jgi:hypothetical protein
VIDYDHQKKVDDQRAALAKEESHYNAVRRVFGSPEGADVLEWLLNDLCGYWRNRLDSEREIGKFELGRTLFNQVCMADIEIAHGLLDRRRKQAEAVRNEERRRIEKQTQ